MIRAVDKFKRFAIKLLRIKTVYMEYTYPSQLSIVSILDFTEACDVFLIYSVINFMVCAVCDVYGQSVIYNAFCYLTFVYF